VVRRKKDEPFLALALKIKCGPGNNGNAVELCGGKQRFQLPIAGWGR
jgi:hypothetical protein